MTDVESLIHMTSSLTDGVARLREVVLHAAVHGTLVPQSRSDEPADVLLTRSRAAVDRQTLAGKSKREKPAAPLDPTEQHFDLPAGWTWARIVDTGQYINGLAFKPSDWKAKGRPIIRIQNLSGRNAEFNYTDGTFDHSVVVHDGDILVSWSATLDAFIWRGVEGVLNQHIFRVVPAPLVDKRYLYWLLKWVIRRMAASDHVHGLVMGHINRGPFLAFPVPIPPLAEQKRIVAKVDELMALCDRLEAQLKQRDEQAGVLAKAAVARFQADPSVENLEYLFDERYVVDPPALRSVLRDLVVTMAADDARGVERALADFLEGESSNGVSKSPSHGNSGIPILRISAGTSRKDQYVDEDDYKLVELTSEEVERHKLRRGDLLSCRYNGNLHYVGRFSCYLGTSGKTHVNPDKLIRFRVDSSMALPRFVCIAMNSTYARRQIESMCATTAGNIGLSASKMKTVRVPIPPLHVQQALVSLHDRVSTLIDQLESQITASEEAGTKLLDALVAELAPSN